MRGFLFGMSAVVSVDQLLLDREQRLPDERLDFRGSPW